MTDPDRMPIPTREFYMKLLESPDLKVFFETHAGEMEIPPFHKFISEICARSGQVPSPSVQVVESTGAGDGFLAALLDCLLRVDLNVDALNDEELRRVMQRACAAGALTTTGYGAIPSLPDAASIDTLMRIMTKAGGAYSEGFGL